MEMFETVITLKPEDQWRPGMTIEKLVQEMDASLQFPGVSNSWTAPIRGRIDMLSTGIKTPVGVKVFGNNLDDIEKVAKDVAAAIRAVPGTSSAYAERTTGGHFIDIAPDRLQLARYGLTVGDVHGVVAMALGAEPVTTIIEGRERYNATIRYPRDLRRDVQSIASQTLIPLPSGKGMIPLGEVAKVTIAQGPASIRTEHSRPVTYIYVDMHGRDLGSYVADAQRAVAGQVKFPAGAYVIWSGQFEALQRAEQRLAIIVPLVLLSIFILLYLNFQSISDALIVLISIPFALTGGLWLMWALNFNISVATVIGFIALAGVAAETGVVMLLYLNNAYADRKAKHTASGGTLTIYDLNAAIVEGAAGRLRPKMMTVSAIIFGLLPIMWTTGAGAEVMQRIAVPMIGGMISSTILTLLVIPAIYASLHGVRLKERAPLPGARSIQVFDAVSGPDKP
jgi:Cu(I)/Ag(I) efflux system membrane protein CusA/SilA